MLHLTLTPSNTPLSFLSSKKQYDETSFNLKLVSFQEEQNFLCDAGKSCLHGKGPNGNSDGNSLRKAATLDCLSVGEKVNNRNIPSTKCVCACVW